MDGAILPRWPGSWSVAGDEARRGALPAAAPALDEAAFAAFYRGTAAGLWRYLRRLGGDAALADDVLQDSYLKFLRQPSRSADERTRTAYLYRIATNLLRDRLRRRQREQSWREQFFPTPPPARRGRNVELEVDVGTVLDTLKPKERALLWLAYVEGYEHREIAEILGLQAASVRVLLFRARKKFSRALAAHNLGSEVRP